MKNTGYGLKVPEPEVGDTFIILNRIKKCKNKSKRFVIKSVSPYYVTYDDTRTNNNCWCSICDPQNFSRGHGSAKKSYDYVTDANGIRTYQEVYKRFTDFNINRQVNKQHIKVIERRLERLRDINLKLILGKSGW